VRILTLLLSLARKLTLLDRPHLQTPIFRMQWQLFFRTTHSQI
jgi:hypothetical protein